ncbi:MAG: hypothetical protein DRG11_03290 [Epsilonproteobacteria bacterium]|nr:MAG: hypothetical protein DRG11_03290 [Campylobacterota bacterium]
MTKYIVLFFAVLLFVSCSSNNSFVNYIFDSTKDYQSLIQNTKKADIIENNNTIKAFMISTYLNQTSVKWDDNIFHFAIGFYKVDEENNKSKYKLTINDYEDINLTKLHKNSSLYESLPIKNSWADYFIVEVAKDDINITINDKLHLKWIKIDENITANILYEQF